jgi:hypothetical protein
MCVTVVPVLCTIGGFALWRGQLEPYWFLALAPSIALTAGLALTQWRPAARPIAIVLALIVILAQPSRVARGLGTGRLPEYGALVRGSREIRKRTVDIRRIDTEFPLPPSTDREFLFRVLGGRVRSESPLVATIGSTGRATFASAAP